MTEVRLERPASVDEFIGSAGAFLQAHEAENCLMLGLCAQMGVGTTAVRTYAPYFAVARSGDRVVGATLIAGFLAVLSHPMDDEALPLLVADIATAAPAVPGVVGPVASSRRFAESWTTHTGRPHRLNMSERIFRLERVIPPRRVDGAMRLTEEGDGELLARWLSEFNEEALGQRVDPAAMHQFAARWIGQEGRRMYLWVVDGRAVSMVGVSGDTAHGIRVAPVYTPRDLRGRGYASALTAAVTQAQLDAGKRYCFLYTDLANPTSNKIYRAIGYEPVIDAADHRFEPPGP